MQRASELAARHVALARLIAILVRRRLHEPTMKTRTTSSLHRFTALALALAALSTGAPAFADEPACHTSADCRGGRVCRGQRCVATECMRDDDCGAGRYCDAAGDCRGGTPTAPPLPTAPPPPPPPPGRAGGAPWAKPLWISSLVTFSFAYLGPVIGVNAVNATAFHPNWANSGFVMIPFVGPWIVVGNASKYIPDYASAMLGLHAVLQTAAAIGFIVGVSNGGEKSAAGTAGPRWAVLPAIGPNQAGLTFTITGF